MCVGVCVCVYAIESIRLESNRLEESILIRIGAVCVMHAIPTHENPSCGCESNAD